MGCQVWGVLNATPDSFSDGGRFLNPDAALAHARELIAAGADVIDVGGESTRPGAVRVTAAEELDRVLPIVTGLAAAGIAVSIDTMRAEVAIAAVAAGAKFVNDVSGGLADADMPAAVASLAADYVLMHWRGQSDVMDSLAVYDDVVADVVGAWERQLAVFVAAGVPAERVIFDPGLGFAKRPEHNWQLLRALPALAGGGHRVLVGASRKRFLADCAVPAGSPDPADRDAATAAVTLHSALAGAWAVRVHDVAGSVAAVRVAARLQAGGGT